MKTEILVITDRSGSMAPTTDDVIGGYNAFIEEQRSVPGEARVTHVQFNTILTTLYSARPLGTVPPLDRNTYRPQGGTALYNAILTTLRDHGARIERERWADLVLVVIITDGQETEHRHLLNDVRGSCQAAEERGWKFVYLAANQDAFAGAQSLGLTGATAVNYAQANHGTTVGYATMSASVTNARTMKP